jgi:hypothetical protein
VILVVGAGTRSPAAVVVVSAQSVALVSQAAAFGDSVGQRGAGLLYDKVVELLEP